MDKLVPNRKPIVSLRKEDTGMFIIEFSAPLWFLFVFLFTCCGKYWDVIYS